MLGGSEKRGFLITGASPCSLRLPAFSASRDASTAVSRSSNRHKKPCLARAEDPQVAELLKAADALIEKLGSAERQLTAVNADGEEAAEGERVTKLVCDESSCVIVPVAAGQRAHGPEGSFVGSSGQNASLAGRPRDYVLSEGEGWKLGYDRNPINTAAFTSFVGSDSWSVSLSQPEFIDFIKLLTGLQRSIATLQTCGEWGVPSRGAEKDESSLELQTERIWMEARAPQKQLFDLTKIFQQGIRKRSESQQAAFHLRFIVNAPKHERQREFEGHFPPEAVMRLLEHLEAYPPGLDSLRNMDALESRMPTMAGR